MPSRFDIDFDTGSAAYFELVGALAGGQNSLFQGLWTDSATGLYYARNRWYDPRTSTWLSGDALGGVDSQDLYAYVAMAPHAAKDPTGLLLDDDALLDRRVPTYYVDGRFFQVSRIGSVYEVRSGDSTTYVMDETIASKVRDVAAETKIALDRQGVVREYVVSGYRNRGDEVCAELAENDPLGQMPSLAGALEYFRTLDTRMNCNMRAFGLAPDDPDAPFGRDQNGKPLQGGLPWFGMVGGPKGAPGRGLAPAERVVATLRKDVGYNITPESTFAKYSHVGRHGTFITDYRAVGEVLGPVRANQRFTVGLFTRSSKNQISYLKAWRLERALGLNKGTLREGFRFTRVPRIGARNPRLPTAAQGNVHFLGTGRGLPGGGPELLIDPIPTSPWP
jgi:RHS repeat-associated protein